MKKHHSSVIKQTQRIPLYRILPVIGSAFLLLHGCSQNSRNEEIQAGKTNITSKDAANPTSSESSVMDKAVTIRSQVANTVDQNGFVLNSPDGNPILVINATGAPFVHPNKDIPVQVTGTVESFVPADIQRKYGLSLDQNAYRKYERKPTIVAESLALAPTPRNLAAAPAGYFDKTIAVKGEVRKIATSDTTPDALALFEDGWVDDIGVLVVGVDRNLKSGPIQEGEHIVVTGTARQPDASLLEKNLGWSASKAQEFISRYKNRPIIVAKNVYPSAVAKQ